MLTSIQIVAPALPPQLDGIGDYTACLSKELAQTARVKLLVPRGTSPSPIDGVEIAPAYSTRQPVEIREIVDHLQADPPDWLVFQYNPFSYGKWGYNPYLPLAIKRARRLLPNMGVALMAHETFVPVVNWKFALMTTWQRWQFRAMGQAADRIFFSTEAWANRFRAWFPGKPVVHLAVGSNIPRVEISRLEARQRLGIEDGIPVIGVFGTAHPSRLPAFTQAAVEAATATGKPFVFLYVGPDAEHFRKQLDGVRMIAEGPFPPDEVSRRISAMDVCLSAFRGGVSTRRGSFVAALQHGVASVATSGKHTDPMLTREREKAFLLTPSDDPAAFAKSVVDLLENPDRREAMGARSQELFEEEFSWSRIGARLLDELGEAPSRLPAKAVSA